MYDMIHPAIPSIPARPAACRPAGNRRRVALLFNANKAYGRDIIAGVASYVRTQDLPWELYLDDDFRCRPEGVAGWEGDGVIADFDDPAVAAALGGSRATVVAVGGSYHDASQYPPNIPYVATDNAALVRQAYHHLIETGLRQFAMLSVPASHDKRWACERELAFTHLMRRDGLPAVIHRGAGGGIGEASGGMAALVSWLRALPKPVGIVAVTDARARLLIQACMAAGLQVPSQVAVIGIDNDPLARALCEVPLSSVMQGSEEMGRTAAGLLHRLLQGQQAGAQRVVVPPAGVNVQASCSFRPDSHPYVTRALHFIRHHAHRGIKSEQVAYHVGLSRSGLDAHFRRELGHSVHEELLRYKLEAAQRYLAAGNVKIAEVAQRCGFTSVQYLYTVFARELGCTPRAYQERMQEARNQAWGAVA